MAFTVFNIFLECDYWFCNLVFLFDFLMGFNRIFNCFSFLFLEIDCKTRDHWNGVDRMKIINFI